MVVIFRRLIWPNAIRLNGNAPIAVMPNWLVDARMAAVSKPSSPSRATPLLDGLVMVSVLFVMMNSRFRRGSIMVHHTRRFSRDPAPFSAFLREKRVGLLTRRIGIIINDAFSRIPLSTIRSSKLSCSTNSLVQQALRWRD